MSNPAVITLADAGSKKGKFKRFVLEDNIGESIHLHVNNMRVDFTIKEFLDFSQMIRDSLKNLDFINGYSLEDFDEHFLKECADFLPSLTEIKVEEVVLSNIQCIVHKNIFKDLFLPVVTPLNRVPAYRYLQGDKRDFLNYQQFNYFSVDNEVRLLKLLESIKKNDYPLENKYIVLFEGQNLIRDGQHRAAVLAHLNGMNTKVKVLRFYFSDKSHLLKITKNNLKFFLKWFAKKVYKKLKR